MTNEDPFAKYGTKIGAGGTAVIYESNGVVAKIFNEGYSKYSVYNEAMIMTIIELIGIPSTRVYGVETCEGRYVLKMNKINGRSMDSMRIDGDLSLDQFLDKLVELALEVNRVLPGDLSALPIPRKTSQLKLYIGAGKLPAAEKEKIYAIIDALPDGNAVCHGDFHGGNILSDGKEYVILDWPEVAIGNPCFDVCRTYLDYYYISPVYVPGETEYYHRLAEEYMGRYSRASGIRKEDILAWLPVCAAALYGYLGTDELNAKNVRNNL
jgi:Predicted aminoglycoside phosphotransferase